MCRAVTFLCAKSLSNKQIWIAGRFISSKITKLTKQIIQKILHFVNWMQAPLQQMPLNMWHPAVWWIWCEIRPGSPSVAEPVRGAEVVVPQSQVDFFEGETLQLNCELTAGNHVSYKWLLNGQLVSPSPLHHVADKNLLIDRLVETHWDVSRWLPWCCQLLNVRLLT